MWFIWLGLSGVVVLIDQITKHLADNTLVYAEPVAIVPSFNLTLLYNKGAAFSFLNDASGWQRWFFVFIALAAVAFILYWLKRLGPGERWTAFGLALVLGGAVGNLIDRLMFGHVIDFIQLYYRDFYWPAFNIADSAITLGAAALILHSLFHRAEEP
jgi:signal peptidase II